MKGVNMVRYLHIRLDDELFKELTRRKGALTWEEFLKKLIEPPDKPLNIRAPSSSTSTVITVVPVEIVDEIKKLKKRVKILEERLDIIASLTCFLAKTIIALKENKQAKEELEELIQQVSSLKQEKQESKTKK